MARDPYKYFRIEAREILEGLTQGALELDRGTGGKESVTRLFRLAHTLKGAARVVRQPDLADIAHAVEDALTPYRGSEVPVGRESVTELLRLIDALAAGLSTLGDPAAPPAPPPAAPARPVTVSTAPPEMPEAAAPASAPKAPAPATVAAPVVAPTAPVAPVALPVPMARAEEAAETVRVEVHELDALLDDVAEAGAQVAALRSSTAALDQVRHLMDTLIEQLGVRHERTGALLGSGTERARATAEEVRTTLGQLGHRLGARLDSADAELRAVRDRARELRLLPVSTVFATLERAARDAGEALGRRVEFTAAGGAHRLDGHILLAARDALAHVVRNAVAHGIEPEAERLAAGKAPVGRVHLAVERRGHRVVFVCSDDGRGMDLKAVRRSAVTRGMLPAAEASALGDHAAAQLVFAAGVSTAARIDAISGRGVGLDVVRATALRFKGDCEARTEAGRSTTIELAVPVSLSSLTALVVEAGGTTVAIPLDAVHRTLRLAESEIACAGDRRSILHEGEALPFAPLGELLGLRAPEGHRRHGATLVLRAAGRLAAIAVDRLQGTADVVIRPLPALAGTLPLVAGAWLDADGDPRLVLDPHGLVSAAHASAGAGPAAGPAARPPILVVDDSLTTRMLEQSILESAGYEVDLAVCADDALARLAARRYGLMISDVEMPPGLNGYELCARVRADAALRELPVILVTSLNSPADRARGTAAGASAYIVKSEFEQDRLLGLIRELAG